MTRAASPTTLAAGSLFVFAGLVAALWWREQDHRGAVLVVYVAPTSRLPMQEIAAEYERETGRRVELRFGASEDLLTRVRHPSPVQPADLFIPADESYIHQARELGLVEESIPIARIHGVLLVAKGNPRGIRNWADLLRDDVRVAVPNPGAAVGKITREHLVKTGYWTELAAHVVDTGTVTEAANATRAGDRAAVAAAIVWDVVAHAPAYEGQAVLELPELDGIRGRIEVAVLRQSADVESARQFARYIAASDRGLAHFRKFKFDVVPNSEKWAEEPAQSRGASK